MKGLIVFLANEINPIQLEQTMRFIGIDLPDLESPDISVPPESLEAYKQLLPGRNITPFNTTLILQYPISVFVEIGIPLINIWSQPLGEDIIKVIKSVEVIQAYVLGPYGRCKRIRATPNEATNRLQDLQAFSRLSGKLDEGFYYFPYGYLYKHSGLGSINEMGHRIARNLLEYAERKKDHKVIAVFGGSAAFGIYLRDEDTFAFKLENKLNDYAVAKSSRVRFSVLNFSTPGAVVLNELLSFITFCHRIKPDIVIAHDGYNDMYYGQMSDMHLLSRFDITYQNNLEEWSQILHDSKKIPVTWQNTWPEVNSPVINYPRTITNAYGARQIEFQSVTKSIGAQFIAGLQPMLLSKKVHSAQEKQILQYHLHGWYGQQHKRMPFLYEKYIAQNFFSELNFFINFHKLFEDLKINVSLFADMVHTSPDGDTHIAEIYFQHILKNNISKIF